MEAAILWSAEAIQDLAEAISDVGPGVGAARLDDGVQAAIASILSFPALGQAGRLMGSRERLLLPLPFVLVYRFDGPQLVLLRLYHCSRQWPPKKPSSKKKR